MPALLRSFPRVFWVANVMELFERAAYYGLNSVLAVYLTAPAATGGLGFGESSVGFLQSLIYACNYVVPILGGALADRYGYRRMLLVAFSLLSAGYFASGYMSAYGAVFASLLVMAAGGGLFKPIISGTIARTTNESNSGFGFGVYYWMINVGAFLAPLVVSVLRGFSWRWVFLASSAYCALMFLPTLFVFRDPPRPENTKGLREVARAAALVLGDARFMLMIVVYSFFWILYFQNFGSVLWYLRDFIDPAPANRLFAAARLPFRFDAEFVTVINAGTIILLQVFVSRIVKDWQPVRTMIAGLAVGALGFLCLAFARHVGVFVLGIAVFSIGEMTAHPKYYSYVGLVAPQDKKAVYMGYAFLYGVFGSLIGSSLGGALYGAWLKPVAGTPARTIRLPRRQPTVCPSASIHSPSVMPGLRCTFAVTLRSTLLPFAIPNVTRDGAPPIGLSGRTSSRLCAKSRLARRPGSQKSCVFEQTTRIFLSAGGSRSSFAR